MGTLGWDEQTMMPPKAASLRGEQQALLSGFLHELVTDARVGAWLADLEGERDPVKVACRRNLGREHARERKVPPALVDALARARSEGFATWIEAKRTSDFARFAPTLQKKSSISASGAPRPSIRSATPTRSRSRSTTPGRRSTICAGCSPACATN